MCLKCGLEHFLGNTTQHCKPTSNLKNQIYWGLKNWTTKLGPEATEVIMRHVELCQVKNISARIDKICIERFETQILLPSQEHQKKFAQQKNFNPS